MIARANIYEVWRVPHLARLFSWRLSAANYICPDLIVIHYALQIDQSSVTLELMSLGVHKVYIRGSVQCFTERTHQLISKCPCQRWLTSIVRPCNGGADQSAHRNRVYHAQGCRLVLDSRGFVLLSSGRYVRESWRTLLLFSEPRL